MIKITHVPKNKTLIAVIGANKSGFYIRNTDSTYPTVYITNIGTARSVMETLEQLLEGIKTGRTPVYEGETFTVDFGTSN